MEYLYHQALNVGIFMILALGLHLINGAAGLFSLGHAGLWAVGAYVGGAYGIYYAPATWSPQLNLFVSCALGFVSSGVMAFFIGLPTLRLKGDYLAMATLGFGQIIIVIINNSESIGGARGLTNIPHWTNLFHVFLGVLFTLFVVVNLLRSAWGRKILSVREDEVAAEGLGINVFQTKLFAFMLGSAFAGLAGALFAHAQQFIHPNNFSFMWSVVILLMIILGGLGSTTGAVVGAVVITLLPEALRFMGETISQWRMVVYSLLLIGLMLARPKGLLGKRELTWDSVKKIFRFSSKEA